jgi:hypothetical protein
MIQNIIFDPSVCELILIITLSIFDFSRMGFQHGFSKIAFAIALPLIVIKDLCGPKHP